MVVDKQLISDCKEFDNRAQSELYNKYSSLMFGICLRYCQSYEEAEDLLQEGFLTIYAKIGQYSGEGSFIGWMRRVMINTILMSFRKKTNDEYMLGIDEINELSIVNQNKELDEEDVNLHDIKSMIEQTHFSHEELLEAVSKLPEGYQVVFNLRVIEGYKHIEIAEALNISESTSKSQLLRARKLLRKNLYELSLEKHTEKRKKKLVYAIAFIGMNDNFNYIDEILKQGFENIKVPPSTDWSALSSKLEASKIAVDSSTGITNSTTGLQQGISQFGQNIISYMTNHVFSIITFFSAAVISVSIITSSSEINNNVGNVKSENPTYEINNQKNTEITINNPETLPQILNESQLLSVEKNNNSPVNYKNNLQKKAVTVIDTIKIPVQKTIYKTKTQIIRDTVKTIKPVFTKNN